MERTTWSGYTWNIAVLVAISLASVVDGGEVLICLGGRLQDAFYTAGDIRKYLVDPLVQSGSNVVVFSAFPDNLVDDISKRARTSLEYYIPGLVVNDFPPIKQLAGHLFTMTNPDRLLRKFMTAWPGDDSRRNSSNSVSQHDQVAGGELLLYQQQRQCLDYFQGHMEYLSVSRILFSRLDARWLCPHPPLDLLNDTLVWIPDVKFDIDEGVYAGHAVFSSQHAVTYLGAWDVLVDRLVNGAFPIGSDVLDIDTWSSHRFLELRLKWARISHQQYRYCAHRTCGPPAVERQMSFPGVKCDSGTQARQDYPWEWVLAVTLRACLLAFGLVQWSVEALRECNDAPVPFPEDIGFSYSFKRGFEDYRKCFQDWNEQLQTFLYLSRLSLRIPDPNDMNALFLGRHRCRKLGHNFLYVHVSKSVSNTDDIESAKFESETICAPSSCSLAASSTFTLRYFVRDRLRTVGVPEEGIGPFDERKASLMVSAIDPYDSTLEAAVEDPATGASFGASHSGWFPRFSVPWYSARGIDFVIAGFPKSGTSSLFANLALHPEIRFSEASAMRHEDSLFSLGHALAVSSQDRQRLRGEEKRNYVLGVYDSTLIQNPIAMARLRALHRIHPLKVIIAVRHPIELLESMLNYLPPFLGMDAAETPNNFLQSEFLRLQATPFFSENELLLVPLDALAQNTREVLDRVCAFLGIRPLSLDAELVHMNAQPRGPWSLVLRGKSVPEYLRTLLESYFTDDVASMRLLLQRFGRWSDIGPALAGPPCQLGARKDAELGCFVERLRIRCCFKTASMKWGGTLPADFHTVGLQVAMSASEQQLCRDTEYCCQRFFQLHRDVTTALQSQGCVAPARSEKQSCVWKFGWLPFDHIGRRPLTPISEALHRIIADRTASYSVQTSDFNMETYRGLVDPEGDISDAHTCFMPPTRDDGLQLTMCLLRVQYKDPWGCFESLRPESVRSDVWVDCCGGSDSKFALAFLAPCPPLQCCTMHVLRGFADVAGGYRGDGVALPYQSWLSCSADRDKRWTTLRVLLSNYNYQVVERSIVSLANDLAHKIEYLNGKLYDLAMGWIGDEDSCFVGAAHVLYVLGVASTNVRSRENYKWQLKLFLNLGDAFDESKLSIFWLFDMGEWPIASSRLVSYALSLEETRPVPSKVPSVFPMTPLVDMAPLKLIPSVKLPGILLLSSHIYALDAALALSSLLAIRQSTSTRAPLRWLGFPKKYLQKWSLSHIQRICTATAGVECDGPGALALDNIIEMITVCRHWPHTVSLDNDMRTSDGGFSWKRLVAEVAGLVNGDWSMDRDIVVCGYPTLFCLALDEALRSSTSYAHYKFGPSFVLILLSGVITEYAAPTLQPFIRVQVHRLARESLNRGLLCFSHFDEAHLMATIGRRVLRLPFGARYVVGALAQNVHRHYSSTDAIISSDYMPPAISNEGSRQILMSRLKLPFGRGGGIPWKIIDMIGKDLRLPFTLVGYEIAYDYEILSDFRAAVFFPWNWELVTFLEWYGLGLPVFVPSASWIVPLIWHTLDSTPDLKEKNTTAFWTNLREDWAYDAPISAHLQRHVEHTAQWWMRTDYMMLPHLRSFSHLVDLLAQIFACDFNQWTRNLHETNAKAHRMAAAHYIHLLERAEASLLLQEGYVAARSRAEIF